MNDLVRMKLVGQLKRDEGDPAKAPRLLKLYLDSRKVPTIGVGHNLRDTTISLAASDHILNDDINDKELDLLSALAWAQNLSDVRFIAIMNMAFELGVHGVLEFRKALDAMRVGDWPTVEHEIIHSDWHDEVPDRCERVAQQFLTDHMV